MKTNRYVMKPDITLDDIKEELKCIGEGGSYIYKDVTHFRCLCYSKFPDKKGEFSINIGFPDNLRKWKDVDHILVLDEDFAQPYMPFYFYFDEDVCENEFLEFVIQKYNKLMDGLSFLEKKE